jgi:hypothetical protein
MRNQIQTILIQLEIDIPTIIDDLKIRLMKVPDDPVIIVWKPIDEAIIRIIHDVLRLLLMFMSIEIVVRSMAMHVHV